MRNNGVPDRAGFWIGQQPTLTLVVEHIAPSLDGRHRFFVEAAAAGSAVSFECETLLEPLKNFSSELLAVHENLQGIARLNFTGSQLEINATIDKHGHVFWAVNLWACDADKPFTFTIEEDQTRLWERHSQDRGPSINNSAEARFE